ncbi:MAG: metallophosphoesterase family protein [Microbacter sp.]
MKTLSFFMFIYLFAGNPYFGSPQEPSHAFRFALITDMHLQQNDTHNTETLRKAINDINRQHDLAFVLVAGDIADKGDRTSMLTAKKLLDQLNIPYYAVPGNHDTRYCRNGTARFDSVFGNHHFSFIFRQVRFIGFNTGQGNSINSGWISDDEMQWLQRQLNETKRSQPLIFVTHFPLNVTDVGNRDRFLQMVTPWTVEAVLGGHYHRNLVFDEDGIPDVLTRTLQSNGIIPGGYSVIEIDHEIRFYEKKLNDNLPFLWLTLPYRPMHLPPIQHIEEQTSMPK